MLIAHNTAVNWMFGLSTKLTTKGKLWINERSSQLDTQLKQLRKLSLKKIQAWTGFEPMTSAIPVQRSTNWAIKPTGSWSFSEFFIYPLGIGHRKKIWVLMSQALALHQSVWQRSKAWNVSTRISLPWTINKRNICFYSPLTQQHSFFRNKPPYPWCNTCNK